MAARYNKHECTICLEDFNKPKLLPCAHTFCQDCLTDHIKAHATKNKFTCPVCRQKTNVPAGGARGFPNNFYLVEEEDKLFCSNHKKMELKFYCRDCSEVVCGDCVVFKHKGHDVDYISTVEDESKQQLKPLTQQLEEKVAELKTFYENLKITLTKINTTADTACKNVDRQTQTICDQLREEAMEIKHNIIKIRDDSNSTLLQMMEDINILITELETGVNCSRDVLTSKTTSKLAVDILPNVQTLMESGRKRSVDLPEVTYPLFPLVDIDTQCLRKLLGKLKTENEGSFSVSFNLMEIRKDEYYESDVHMIQGLPWILAVLRVTSGIFVYLFLMANASNEQVMMQSLPWRVVGYISDMFVYLGLKEGGYKHVESCIADATIKLVNQTDDSKSVVVKSEGTKYDKNYWYKFTDKIMYIDWECITDPSNGFLENNRFTLLTQVHVSKVNKL